MGINRNQHNDIW